MAPATPGMAADKAIVEPAATMAVLGSSTTVESRKIVWMRFST